MEGEEYKMLTRSFHLALGCAQVDARWAAVAEARPRMQELFDVRQVEPSAPRGMVVRAPLRIDPRQIAAESLLL